MELSLRSTDEVVEEIMRMHRLLPTRPEIDDIEAAKNLIENVGKEDRLRIEAIARQKKNINVPEELFMVLQEMQNNLVYFQSLEQKREALRLLELENIHTLFDDLIQTAAKCIPSSSASVSHQSNYPSTSTSATNSSKVSLKNSASFSDRGLNSPLANSNTSSSSLYYDKQPVKNLELFTRDDSYVKKVKPALFIDGIGSRLQPNDKSAAQIMDSTIKPTSTSGQDGEKLSLIRLASLIEVSSKKGTQDLNLKNKLMDQIDWLPNSIGKLSSLITLDLSENQIMTLPETIGGLLSLTKLDVHSNRINELPESIVNLLTLLSLDLRGNRLTYLPPAFGQLVHLEELDLSSNQLCVLPQSIGSLVSLKKLNVETNNFEEFPHTIGQLSSLKELRADYNRLKALPEAVGRLVSLEILSVRYNNVSQLPTTMSSLPRLMELDVSFNELESVPESLCFATSLVKMNVSNNFADLRSLPRSIGNLEMLEELDISNNQIRFLPDSFGMLLQLRVLRVEGNPLEFPPKNIIDMGPQSIVKYVAELVAKRGVNSQPVKQKKKWYQICFCSRSN